MCVNPRCLGMLVAYEKERYCHYCCIPIFTIESRKFYRCRRCGLSYDKEDYGRLLERRASQQAPQEQGRSRQANVPAAKGADAARIASTDTTENVPIMVEAQIIDEEQQPADESDGVEAVAEIAEIV